MVNKINNSHEDLVGMIDSIEALGMLPPEYFADLLVCIDEHKKLTEAKDQVWEQYVFNFKEGGWNTVHAFNKQQAIKYPKETWKDFKDLTVDVKTVRILTKEADKQLMSLFH